MKTEVCSFSGLKIFPGRGTRFVRGDSKLFYFRTSKDARLWHQKKKPAKFHWTVVYRRLNKKGTTDTRTKRRRRAVKKTQRAVVGMDMELLKQIRKENPEKRKERLTVSEAEIRERRKKAAALAKANKASSGPAGRTQKARGTANKGR
eukprot:TRINITY_DN12808_c0_g1_i1.p2 TRINITY_DN12808_c0_g1~~TRINITY_DN12808_c0_g1_i1.p2  ORF type:complete len:148 (-),score=43.67 TRINITY_DN12808_c0_g1_i1:51-494(-)